MKTVSRRGRWLARAAALIGLTFATVGPAGTESRYRFSAPPDSIPVSVTSRDIEASNAEVASAYGALMSMWTSHFEQLGTRFEQPDLVRYRGTVRTDCGLMPRFSGLLCGCSICFFFDVLFFAVFG
jgi:predicted metalloprotease